MKYRLFIHIALFWGYVFYNTALSQTHKTFFDFYYGGNVSFSRVVITSGFDNGNHSVFRAVPRLYNYGFRVNHFLTKKLSINFGIYFPSTASKAQTTYYYLTPTNDSLYHITPINDSLSFSVGKLTHKSIQGIGYAVFEVGVKYNFLFKENYSFYISSTFGYSKLPKYTSSTRNSGLKYSSRQFGYNMFFLGVGVGFSKRIYKNNRIFFDIFYQKGFNEVVEITYSYDHYDVYRNFRESGSANVYLDGTHLSCVIGYRTAIRFRKKEKEDHD